MAKQKTTPNAKGQVKLREKALADGSKSLYLDINMNGKRHKEYLKPKSVIRISLCRTAKRNLLIFPI